MLACQLYYPPPPHWGCGAVVVAPPAAAAAAAAAAVAADGGLVAQKSAAMESRLLVTGPERLCRAHPRVSERVRDIYLVRTGHHDSSHLLLSSPSMKANTAPLD